MLPSLLYEDRLTSDLFRSERKRTRNRLYERSEYKHGLILIDVK